jgi:hypothetical protein
MWRAMRKRHQSFPEHMASVETFIGVPAELTISSSCPAYVAPCGMVRGVGCRSSASAAIYTRAGIVLRGDRGGRPDVLWDCESGRIRSTMTHLTISSSVL